MLIFQLISELKEQVYPAQLLVVTKNRNVADIKMVMGSGIRLIGESRLQEIQEKFDPSLLNELRQKGIELHFIGHLQKNKVAKVVSVCDVIQTVDSLELAQKINQEAAKLNKIMPVFFQLNLTGEEQKQGFQIPHPVGKDGFLAGRDEVSNLDYGGKSSLPRLRQMVQYIQQLSYLKLLGFMCMGKQDDPETTRQTFRWCKQLADQLSLREISMGMSEDYQIALEEGSTLIRLGSKLFHEGD
ncbi:MAG: YggS family pyridoxal phosphate enzyme [bacterium]|nr:YggS family pyridoxal phosphate enzyme [bacterium]